MQVTCVTADNPNTVRGDVLHSAACFVCFFVCLLFYTIATVFQLYHGGHMIWDEKEKGQAYTFTDSRDF